ncbi:MAG: polysaccharide pyruvyl transferase CsaB [Clostridia bacterium]|nr:MAG: polysaccharide pyruvyl transferase CsaB [Clostridia bacterium]
MSRAAVCGYFGFNNAGDEAVLYAMLRAWRTLYPGCEPLVLSADPEATRRAYQVEAAPRWPLPQLAAALRQVEVLVHGGGSLLQDTTGLPSLLYYLGVIHLARRLGKPVAVFCQGMGPLESGLSRRLVPRVLDKVDLLSVRDQDSAQLLKKIGVIHPVEVYADPVFLLDPEAVAANVAAERQSLVAQGLASDRKLAAFALRPWPGWERVAGEVVATARWLQDHGWQVVFLPFQPPQDAGISQQLARQCGAGAVVLTWSQLPSLIGLVGNMNLMIGMRLHALILAALLEIPAVGLVYDPKVKSFLAQAGLPGLGPPEWGEGKLLPLVTELLAAQKSIILQVNSQVRVLRHQARAGMERLGQVWPGIFH